jgi:hypothetical protein
VVAIEHPAPMGPAWLDAPDDPAAMPKKMKKSPIHMFAHGVCIEPLVGNLGLSYGRIEADFTRAANTVLSQLIDAATLGNSKSYIVSEQVTLEKDFSVQPGKMNKVAGVVGAELGANIMPIDPGPANPQLFQVLELMQKLGESAIQAPSILSGTPGKSGETWRGAAARIEQATKQISVAARKFTVPLKQILENNARLNSIFMPDEELLHIAMANLGKAPEVRVTREMYQRGYKVEVRADLRFISQMQRVQEAQEMIQLPAAVPPLQGNIPFIYHSVLKYLQASGRHDMIPMLGPPPPPPETTLGIPPPMMGMPPVGPGEGMVPPQ